MAEKTLGDFIKKENKDIPFDERAKKFEERIKPICEELGVIPWATLGLNEEAIIARPVLKDLWLSN